MVPDICMIFYIKKNIYEKNAKRECANKNAM